MQLNLCIILFISSMTTRPCLGSDKVRRRVTTRHFGFAAVEITDGASFNTAEDVAMLDPKSEVTGGRRYPFVVQSGTGNLFQRCYAREGRHNFVTGSRVPGPNVWLDCLAEASTADDGPHHRWATGVLSLANLFGYVGRYHADPRTFGAEISYRFG